MVRQLNKLKLVLNVTKTEFMCGLTLRRYQSPFLMFLQENVIKLEPRCKYFGILLNERIFFRHHIENVVKEFKTKCIPWPTINPCVFNFWIPEFLFLTSQSLYLLNSWNWIWSSLSSSWHLRLGTCFRVPLNLKELTSLGTCKNFMTALES